MFKHHGILRLLVVSLCCTAPSALHAQTTRPPLAELLPRMYANQLILEYLVLIDVFGVDSDVRLASPDTVRQIIAQARAQLSSFPLPSSAGGFTWTFDSASGTFNRASNSFGPIYADRALTIGKKHFNVGTAFQRVTFDQLDGQKLQGDQIVAYNGVLRAVGTTGIFFADGLDLDVSSDTLVTFATYGLTDRWDISVAVPFNRVQIKARLTTRVADTETGVAPHIQPLVTEDSGHSQGIGDVVARTKYNFLRARGGGLAAALDLRLPTGDEANLLGVAGAQAKVFLGASTTRDKLSPHVNVGYTVSGSSAAANNVVALIPPPDEFNYTGGADIELSLRSTLALDIVGRTLRRAGTLDLRATAFGTNYREFELQPGKNLNLLLGSTGVKFTPFANMLITGNVLYPLSSSGLTDKLTWMFGVEYSF